MIAWDWCNALVRDHNHVGICEFAVLAQAINQPTNCAVDHVYSCGILWRIGAEVVACSVDLLKTQYHQAWCIGATFIEPAQRLSDLCIC